MFKVLSKVKSDNFSPNSIISSGNIAIRGSVFVDLSQVLMLLISVLVCLDTVFPIEWNFFIFTITDCQILYNISDCIRWGVMGDLY